MLTLNEDLSVSKIRTILHKTADMVGGYNYNWSPFKPGHSKELGYGRLNAFKALLLVQGYGSVTADIT